MFGANEVTKPFRDEKGNLLVNEIFYTIQGEGPDSGCPAVFIRLAKCNLRCYFCDTEFETGMPRSVANICHVVQEMTAKNNCRLVVITGGEPFLQNFAPLAAMLNQNGIRVSVETAGTVWSKVYEDIFGGVNYTRPRPNKIICSPKTMGLNREIIPFVSAWKYIVARGQVGIDGLPFRSTQREGVYQKIYRPRKHSAPIYVQPMDEKDVVKNDDNMKLARDVAMLHGYRLSLQVHKIIGVP